MNIQEKYQEKWTDPLISWRLWLSPAAMAVFLVVVAQYNFLTFHTLAELFAIMISFIMFAVAWSTRAFSINNFLLFLACGYLWIGSLDLVHLLVYKGMNVLVEGNGNLSVQFWISTRYFESLLLLAAPFAAARKQNGNFLVIVFGVVAVGLTALILSGQFPVGFIEGSGLTNFKIYSEYLIILILVLALGAIFRHGRYISTEEKVLIAASIVMTMCAELMFTFYVSVYGISNLVGHIFKIFSFWFIFQAIVISNLRKPYTALQESGEKLRTTLNSIGDAVIAADTSGKVTSMNPVAAKLTSWEASDAVGRPLTEVFRIINAKTKERLLNPVDKVIEGGKVVGLANHTILVARDGSEYQIADSAAPIMNDAGRITGVVLVFRDVTKEYATKEALITSELKFRRLFENAEISIWNEDMSEIYKALDKLRIDGVTDLHGYLKADEKAAWEMAAMINVRHVNEATLKLFGAKTENEFLYQIDKTFGPDAIDIFISELCAIWNKQRTFRSEAVFKTIDGKKEINAIISFQIPETEEGFGAIPVSIIDITDHKRAEELSVRLGRIVEQSVNEIYMFDEKTLKFIMVNRGARENLGYTIDELELLTPCDLKPEVTPQSFEKLIKPLRDGATENITFKTIHKRKDGSTYDVEVFLQLMPLETPPVFVAIILDITERKKLSDAFAQAQCQSHVGSWEWDIVEDEVMWSDETYRIFGIEDQKEEISLNLEMIESMTVPDDRLIFREALEDTLSNRRKNYQVVFRIARPGGEVRYIEAIGETTYNLNGEPIQLSGSAQDITDHKRAEASMREAKEDAEKANKAKSEFLASMSHEFRTPLNAVLGFAQMLQFDPNNSLSPTQNSHVESILDGGDHLLKLVNDILDLARIEADQISLSLEEVAANEIVTDCIFLTTQLGESRKIKIIDNLGSRPSVHLRTDRMRLKQVMLNLLSNAVKFNKNGGSVTVDGQETDDGFLHISVTDTGIGIAKEDAKSVFQMFHRIGADPMVARDGMGMGLAVTKLLVERMAGRVGVESELGVGSTFWVELPLASNKRALIWSDSLHIGVDAIDKDHQTIIHLLNKLTHRSIDDTDLDSVIDELEGYTHYHFQREEAVMEVCGYPGLKEHRDHHRKLVAEVNNLANKWRDNYDPETLHNLRKFLREWWIAHIVKVDAGITQYTAGKDENIQKALEIIVYANRITLLPGPTIDP